MDKPKSPPPPPVTTVPSPSTATASKHSLEKIKSLLMKCAVASTPAKSLTSLQKAFIEKRIEQLFPDIHTPDHPPYAWMIENAIRQLNEEGGSSEEAISKFILEEYKDLPFAHAALLKHHLRELSESGDLVQSHDECYLIGKSSVGLNRTSRPSQSVTYTTSPSPSLSPSSSSTPIPSSSSSLSYESSSTYSSSQSFGLKGKKERKKKTHEESKRKTRQKAKGIKIRSKYNEGYGREHGHGRGRGRDGGGDRVQGRGQGRSQGRGRGRSRGRDSSCSKPENMMMEVYVGQVEDEMRMEHTEATEIQYVMLEDESADEATEIQYVMLEDEAADENIQGKEQPQALGTRDSVGVESRALQSTTSPQEKLVSRDNSSTPRTVPESGRKKLISEQGRKKGRPRKSSTIHSMPTPQTGRGRCRPHKREMQMGEDQHSMPTPQTGRRRGRPRKREMQMGEEQHSMPTPQTGRRRGRPRKREMQMGEDQHSMPTPQTGRRRGRPRKRDMQMGEDQHYRPDTEVCPINDDNMSNELSCSEWLTYDFFPLVKVNMMEGESEHVGQVERDEGDMLDELIEEVYMELMEATEIHNLTTEIFNAQSNQGEIEWIEVRDHAEGTEREINQQSTAGQIYEINDAKTWEQEHKSPDDLNELQLQECTFATPCGPKVVVEQKYLEQDQVSWTEEQNHAQIHVEVKGQNHTAGIQDEISGTSLMDQVSERSNVGIQEREYQVDEYLDEKQLEEECWGNPAPKEAIENQSQPQPCQTGLALVLDGPLSQESNDFEQQVQQKGGEMEIIGQIDMREGQCPLIEEENHIEKAFEVLEEQNDNIERPEVILEQNQPGELHCLLVGREGKNNEEYEHCDELKITENEDSEEQSLSGKTQTDEHSKKPHNVDQNQQSEEQTILFSEQTVEIADHHQPVEEFKRMGTETLKVEDDADSRENTILTTILGDMEQQNKCEDKIYVSEQQSDISGLQTPTVEPQNRQLRPRPLKFQPDQTEDQFGFQSAEKSSESNQRHKLRPRPSKNEPLEVSNKAESLAANREPRKR
ncbi:hypothetical protein DH2020_011848 [Rehmannia glutinosa]|uniref:H15 domain-containing protein n=1 Tax=Rehmannia glutinosa TaxID=99300 RepID=A0ABR0XEJ7_REHGL